MAASADALGSHASLGSVATDGSAGVADEPSSRHLDDVGPISVLSAMIEQRRASQPAIPIEEERPPETLREGMQPATPSRARPKSPRDSAPFVKAR